MRTLSLAIVPFLVACTGNVDIGPDNSGAVSAGSGHGHHGTQGGVGGGTVATTTTVGPSVTAVSSGASTGAGGSSCCSATQKMVTAELDPAQRVVGVVDSPLQPRPGVIADGPFFLTDLTTTAAWFVDTGKPCGNEPYSLLNGGPVHGIRFFVPAGQTLCTSDQGQDRFGGFRPY